MRSWLHRLVLPLVATLGLLSVAIISPQTSRSAFTSSTSTPASVGTADLVGPHAPHDGVAQFTGRPVPGGCELAWSALAGGTAVAEQFELTSEPSGSSLSLRSSLGASTEFVSVSSAVTTYRLLTRAAGTWVSTDAESQTTTCIKPGLVSVAAGETATCGIRSDRTLWCWGFGQRLATGNDEYLTATTPTLESSDSWRQVDIAIGHGCGIQSFGTLWCWGDNWTGQLGDGTTNESVDPVQIGTAADWINVETFGYTTCGIRLPGTLWCWGRNEYGQMGDGTTTASSVPIQIGTADDWDSVAGGTRHTCGVRTSNLWCWGQNIDGEVGDGTATAQSSPVQIGDPGVWSGSLGLGEQHSCGVQTVGTLWCWGTNWFGERGSAASLQAFTPQQVDTDTDWTQVSSGKYFSCATKIDQSMWCTGTNLDGRTGQGSSVGATEGFTQVGSGTSWAVLSVGAEHVCATLTDATMRCWGSNKVGQAGQPDTTWQSPQAVNADLDWSELQAGYNHMCGIKTDATLWCWGENSSAQLGQNHKDDGVGEPSEVANGGQWTSVGTGDFHSCGVKLDGTLWCWGRNDHGQLGTGTTTPSDAPVQTGSDTDWVRVGTGRSHNCATKTNGTLWCWGVSDAGTIGNGASADVLAPVQIGTANNWSSFDAGFRHSCAIRTDGTLWCWGANGRGQVGDGTGVDRLVPTRVGTDTNWSTIGSGRDHSCAVKTTGTLWCWGSGSAGQIGDGATNDRLVPTQAGVATSWVSADGGHNYSCARRTDNTLWCWGRNGAGNFGSGTIGGITASPIQTTTGFTRFTVSTGHWHTCGINAANQMSCWGANYSGQLGYDASVLAPVEVDGSHTWS